MNTTLRRSGIAAMALGASLSLAACGGNDSSPSATDTTGGSTTGTTSDAGAQTFGSGCAAVPKSGPGSFMLGVRIASGASLN